MAGGLKGPHLQKRNNISFVPIKSKRGLSKEVGGQEKLELGNKGEGVRRIKEQKRGRGDHQKRGV